MTKIAEALLKELTYTPQSREYLCDRVSTRLKRDVNDRTLRDAKKELIHLGIVVCSNSHTKGYWIGNASERRHTANEMRKRGLELLREADRIEGIPIDGQLRWVG